MKKFLLVLTFATLALAAGKRNYEWPAASKWGGYFTQDSLGGVTQSVSKAVAESTLTGDGFALKQNIHDSIAASTSSLTACRLPRASGSGLVNSSVSDSDTVLTTTAGRWSTGYGAAMGMSAAEGGATAAPAWFGYGKFSRNGSGFYNFTDGSAELMGVPGRGVALGYVSGGGLSTVVTVDTSGVSVSRAVQLSGATKLPVGTSVTTSSATLTTSSARTVRVTYPAGACTITLPAPTSGLEFEIVNASTASAGTIILAYGSSNILYPGSAAAVAATPAIPPALARVVKAYSDGTYWYVGYPDSSRAAAVADSAKKIPTAGTAGTYRSVTTDAYGRVISGTTPTALGPGYGVVYGDTVMANHYLRKDTAQTMAGALTVTPAVTLTGGINGKTDGSSASTGIVGEVIESRVTGAAGVALSTGVTANVTSIPLTAGDWEVSGLVNFSGTSVTVAAGAYTFGGTSITSASLPGDGTDFAISAPAVTSTSMYWGSCVAPKRVTVSASTTCYLTAYTQFTAGTVKAYGFIHARRVR